MLRFIISLLVLLALLPGLASAQNTDVYVIPNDRIEGVFRVTSIADGDTIHIDYNGVDETIRLIGVDTPETVDPRTEVQAYGVESSAFLTNLLSDESVYLVFGQDQRDKYGRMLAYLYRYPDGLFVNLEIVRQGYGHALTGYPNEWMDAFLDYETQARSSKKGLWANPDVVYAEEVPSPPEAPAEPTPQSAWDRWVENPAVTHYVDEPVYEDESTGAGETVYITDTGSKYHASGCRHLRKSSHGISRDDAESQGYSPCSVCDP